MFGAIRACLDASDPAEKIELVNKAARALQSGVLQVPGQSVAPECIRAPAGNEFVSIANGLATIGLRDDLDAWVVAA